MVMCDFKKQTMVLQHPVTDEKVRVTNLGTVYNNGRISGIIVKTEEGKIMQIPTYNFAIWQVMG